MPWQLELFERNYKHNHSVLVISWKRSAKKMCMFFIFLQFQRYGGNIAQTKLRAISIANVVDSVSVF
jgi:hypothetical protein